MTNTISPDTTYDIITAPNRDSLHWQPGTVTWQDLLDWMQKPALKKACGNYMLGTIAQTTTTHGKGATAVQCTNYHRTKTAVRTRGVVALDVDHPGATFLVDAAALLDHAAIIHTTYSSTLEEPRYRVLVPLDRPVAPDEYHTAAAALMQLLGEAQFDPGSTQAERYMFMPSESRRGLFSHVVLPGGPASADKLLADFQADLSSLPAPKPNRTKRDPFGIAGPIGAFNTVYADIGTLIEKFDLPYVPAGDDRWQLVGASAAAGMGLVTDGLVYSHHANDPAYGQTCSAFDLARLHLFGHLDDGCKPDTPVNRLPSTIAMLEEATLDKDVALQLLGGDFADELTASGDAVANDSWKARLALDPRTGQARDNVRNWDLIAAHDPVFQGMFYNELTFAIELDGDLPWRTVTPDRPAFDAGDRAELPLHIERAYGFRPMQSNLDNVLIAKANQRRVNPVRDYLLALPAWDGTPRVETCLPGVRPTAYTRLVARKALVAAAARMMEPGIKWDHMLVLFGSEGLGKSYWLEKIARGYSSSLGPVGHKDTLITMQRSWIMTSDEGHAMRQSEFDAQKEFITRTADMFRMPYDRESHLYPRHCVIWGTTNEEQFLRKQEGNRRFHIVRCEDKVDFDQLTDAYVDQLWAEAMHLYRAGERLWLTEQEARLAATAREVFTEETPLEGLIQNYVDTLVPANWDSLSPESRSLWLQSAADGFEVGSEPITQLCSMQVWVEALGRRRGEHRRTDLLEINAAIKNLPGWQPGGQRHVPGYGSQKVYVRSQPAAGAAAQDFADLL